MVSAIKSTFPPDHFTLSAIKSTFIAIRYAEAGAQLIRFTAQIKELARIIYTLAVYKRRESMETHMGRTGREITNHCLRRSNRRP